MALKLFLLFTIVPLVELVLLIWLASATSFWFTLAIVLISGFLGAAMARREGMHVWMQAQREMSMGRFPADSLVDGLIILIGGILLITPGILTDFVGFSTLIPPIRYVYRTFLKTAFKGSVKFVAMGQGFPGAPPPPGESPQPETRNEMPGGNPFDDNSPFSKIKEKD